MNLDDYLIDQHGLQFPRIFEDWQVVLPGNFSVWLINRFGDMFLVLPDESIHWLEVGSGAIKRVANSRQEFAALIDAPHNCNTWLRVPLVDQLVAEGLILGSDQCYSFAILPPILGGSYTADNIRVSNLYVHYTLLGQLATQQKVRPQDFPTGLKVISKGDDD